MGPPYLPMKPMTIDRISEALGELRAGQRELLRRFDAQDERLDKHDKRIVANERWRWRLVGAAGVVSAAVAAGCSLIL